VVKDGVDREVHHSPMSSLVRVGVVVAVVSVMVEYIQDVTVV
jgi:hypothetical protein